MQYILTFLLLFTLTHAKSNDYSIILDEDFNNVLIDVQQDYDRSISAIGFKKQYTNHNAIDEEYTNAFDYLESVSGSHGSQMHLIKLDYKTAHIKLRKTAKLNRFNQAIALVKTPQNGYFVGGHTLDGKLIIAKLTANGSIIFVKEFGTKNYDRMNNLILMSDGGVLSVGSSTTTRSPYDNMFETGLGLNDIFLTRFSKNGEKLWSKKYGTQYDDKGIDAVEARDGSIIVIGKTDYENTKNVTFMRIGENGNKIWLKHFKSSTSTTPYKVIKLRNNNFVVSLSIQNDMRKEQIRLIKFDIQNNILGFATIDTSYSSVLKDIKEYSNSNIIGVGYTRDRYNTDGLVMILDSDFALLHQEHFGDENYDEFNGVKILHNGQAAVVGIKTNNTSEESNMWILKLNKDLSIAQLSSKASNMYEDLVALFQQDIQSGVLEIKEDLSINLLSKDLLFKIGKYKLNKKQDEFLQKFSLKLFNFLKPHYDSIQAFEVNGHTSSEWHNSTFTDTYIKNEELSMKRSFETFTCMFKAQDEGTKKWLINIMKGSGYNYSKKVVIDNEENKIKSRRSSFKIILNRN